MKEVQQHRHEILLTQRRDVVELENLEDILVQAVPLGIEQPPERTGEGVRRQRIAQDLILDRVDQIRERSTRRGREQVQRAMQHPAMDGVTVTPCSVTSVSSHSCAQSRSAGTSICASGVNVGPRIGADLVVRAAGRGAERHTSE